ncbi:MAG TPA: class I SAM-dependent methyltransferase [Anaeromyxobacter sp.]|nr:class I SAM-dependent methyltransferase [Anaeromyxobacter sp.]
MEQGANLEQRKAFYDSQAQRKLRDYLRVNRRLELGLRTVVRWAGDPSRILEVGCGAGSVSHRLARRFRGAEVVAVDVSRGNLDIAEQYFRAPNLRFVELAVDRDFAFGSFDVIVLMDVYEHVAVAERAKLHENLRRSLNEGGVVVLTVPTPRYLAYLRENDPAEVQPVDEDIGPGELLAVAASLERDLLYYEEVSVWRAGDYAHAVIGRSTFPRRFKLPRRERFANHFVRLGRALHVRGRRHD